MTDERLCLCGHDIDEHGKECSFYDTPSKRELCLKCPGYEDPGYPTGRAWHRFSPKEEG